MPAKLTQQEFIDRAIRIHGSKYDYSKVNYTNKDAYVTIICPEHGEFEQTPNNHMKGKGCAKCKPNHKMTQDEFIAKANQVHDNQYDYTDTIYTKSSAMVTVRCLEHGVFTQTANSHIMGHGCPECGKIKSANSDYMSRIDTRKSTCLERYGVENPMQLDDVKEKQKQTVIDIYGVNNIMKLPDVVEKAKQTNLEKYGATSYAGSKEGLSRIQATLYEKYGVTNFMQSDEHLAIADETLKKAQDTSLERYGSSHYSKSEYYKVHKNEYKQREIQTKLENNTFNTSKPETIMYDMLVYKFGTDDVERQYSSDVYPFACDFYIKSRDMYIELNASWTHGRHYFDINSDNDVLKLSEWQEKAKISQYYENAIQVWTIRDVNKRDMALQNNLNYLVFWDNELRDFDLWVAHDCPDSKDWNISDLYISRPLSPYKPVKFTGTYQNISMFAKYYQFSEFYKRELEMWYSNTEYKGLPVCDYIYHNRLQYVNKQPHELTDREILRTFKIAGIVNSYSVFDVTLMQQILDKYAIKSVYDPCAGWGERMLCCYNNGVAYYGVDINAGLQPGYENMIHDFDMKDQFIMFSDSSEADLSHINANAVITCPPYGKIEKYSELGAENMDDKSFLEWWSRLVQNSLTTGIQYFCFQINQKYKDKMLAIVESYGFDLLEELTYATNKSSHFTRGKDGVNKKHEYESMLVLKHK